MPIEFHCHRCRKRLRVADSSRGKSCVCPSCSEDLTIPFESDDYIPLVALEEVKSELDVPCPRCRGILSCDPALLGTRGVCRGCGTIFEISESPTFDPALNENAFAFVCPACDFLFEGKPFMEGRKGKCTSCAEVFTIRKYEPPPLAVTPIPQRSRTKAAVPNDAGKKANPPVETHPSPVAKPKSSPNPKVNPRPAASVSADPFNSLDNLLPKPNFVVPSYYESANLPRPRSASDAGSLKGVLWVFGILFASGMLLTVVGGIAIFAFRSYASPLRDIAAGDYSITGREVAPANAPTASNVDLREFRGPRDVITKGRFTVDVMQLAASPRAIELSERLQNAMKQNRDWFLESIRNAKVGEPLPYDPRLGLSEAEYNEFLALYKKMTLQKTREATLTITTQGPDVYVLDGGQALPDLTGIEIDLNEDVVRTPFAMLKNRSEISSTADSPIGAADGVEWRHEHLDPSGVTGMVAKLSVGRLRSSGRGVMNYEVTKISQDGRTSIMLVLNFDLPPRK